MDAISKKFMMMDSLAKALGNVDNRVQGRVTHKAHTIFLVALAASLQNAKPGMILPHMVVRRLNCSGGS